LQISNAKPTQPSEKRIRHGSKGTENEGKEGDQFDGKCSPSAGKKIFEER
jgi:hypothetical protein